MRTRSTVHFTIGKGPLPAIGEHAIGKIQKTHFVS
jgi:hypothetical protein